MPTIHDLLLPVDQRPKTFPLGQRDYDPAKPWPSSRNVDKVIFLYDTSKPGLTRTPEHEYGTKLTEAERYELIEYLKLN